MTTQAEDEEIEVAAEVVKDRLYLVSPEKRLAVLTSATAREEAAHKERESGPLIKEVADWLEGYEKSPAVRYWHDIMRFKSTVIQVFTRNITNNHSKQVAAKILFAEHRNGTGSRWLPDCLDGLPSIKVDRKKAAALADEEKITLKRQTVIS